MKTEERVFPELVQATRESPRRAVTSENPIEVDSATSEPVEIPADWVEEDHDERPDSPSPRWRREGRGEGLTAAAADDPPPGDRSGKRVVNNNLKTAEINIERDRRSTLTSPIPAIMAENMRRESGPPADDPRDPAAPEQNAGELTRRLGDSDRHLDRDTSAGYTVEVVDDGNAERRQRAARLIDRARASREAGDLVGAVRAAEEALEEADQAAPPGIVEVIEPARPLLARIFADYVGSMQEVPVLGRRLDEIQAMSLDARKRAVIARVDGIRTLDEIFDSARISASDAPRIAAALLRAGILRVV